MFGPRLSGKSTYLKACFPKARYHTLLHSDELFRLAKDPAGLRRALVAEGPRRGEIVIIDEIQKLPILLDEVQSLIDEHGLRFILTGSSARKLRRSGVNLLGGRATQVTFHPLNSAELSRRFKLDRALQYGTLPPVWLSSEPWHELRDYVDLYLREEIMAEGLTRNLPAFSRFLDTAARCNGQLIQYTKIAGDAQISKTTAFEYFQVLKDTLIASELPSYTKTRSRKAIQLGKFFFFDGGVARYLQGRDRLERKHADYGEALEAFLHHELRAWTDQGRREPLCYWRSTSDFEVDFILDDRIAIEVKATARVQAADLKGLRALKEEGLLARYLLVSLDPKRQQWDGIECVPVELFLSELWSGRFDP